MGLGAFRESSELEFGADSAFIVARYPDEPNRRTLLHLKARHGELSDIELSFDGATQRFDVATAPTIQTNKVRLKLADLWASTPAAEGRFDG
jgi:replicative DNA helicase